jgi:ribosome-associated toxin RatA of RatAB toxin-antitoxin module
VEKIQRSALVHFSATQMFQLVDDIARYPEFVPYCQSAEILSRAQDKVSATLVVAKSGIAKSFSTENTLVEQHTIHIKLLNGPFKYLQGSWHFKALSESACKVELELEYEFKNKLASLAFAKIFNQLTQSMVSAFTERAGVIYKHTSIS